MQLISFFGNRITLEGLLNRKVLRLRNGWNLYARRAGITARILPGLLATGLFAAQPELPAGSGDDSLRGEHIQRTMGLLASSTPENRQAVKILFYGQSITGTQWNTFVEQALRERYPNADLVVENLALGGYSSPYLVKTAELDVLQSQPDLVVFHVYGDHVKYEEIIHIIRQRTAAEVMIMTDHWKRSDWKNGGLTTDNWTGFFDRFLPMVAKKYACELVDVRGPWKDLLEQNGWKPDELLRDNVHLNDKGRAFMAQLALHRMLFRPELETPYSKGLVKTLSITTEEMEGDLSWNGNVLEFEFEGSRIDLLREHAGGASCTVLIDGKPPSCIPELTRHSRTTSIVKPYEWPELMRVGFTAIPEPQVWTLTLDSVDPESKTVRFHLTGSLTGPDGSGSSGVDFVSNSGQVTIGADDWSLKRKGAAFRDGIIRPGMKIRWQTVRFGDDLYFPGGRLERDRLVTHTLAAGLSNSKHTVKLVSDGVPPPISGIRIYRPMLPEGPFREMGVTPDGELHLEDISAPTPLN